MTGRHRADGTDDDTPPTPDGYAPVPARRDDDSEGPRPVTPSVGVSPATLLLTLGVGIGAVTALCIAALLRR